jgi:hypothetical protein
LATRTKEETLIPNAYNEGRRLDGRIQSSSPTNAQAAALLNVGKSIVIEAKKIMRQGSGWRLSREERWEKGHEKSDRQKTRPHSSKGRQIAVGRFADIGGKPKSEGQIRLSDADARALAGWNYSSCSPLITATTRASAHAASGEFRGPFDAAG